MTVGMSAILRPRIEWESNKRLDYQTSFAELLAVLCKELIP